MSEIKELREVPQKKTINKRVLEMLNQNLPKAKRRKKIKFDYELLLYYINKYNIVVEQYIETALVNRNTRIIFTCECGKTGCNKAFRYCITHAGIRCKECTYKFRL